MENVHRFILKMRNQFITYTFVRERLKKRLRIFQVLSQEISANDVCVCRKKKKLRFAQDENAGDISESSLGWCAQTDKLLKKGAYELFSVDENGINAPYFQSVTNVILSRCVSVRRRTNFMFVSRA